MGSGPRIESDPLSICDGASLGRNGPEEFNMPVKPPIRVL